jgi:hypothetical protein
MQKKKFNKKSQCLDLKNMSDLSVKMGNVWGAPEGGEGEYDGSTLYVHMKIE